MDIEKLRETLSANGVDDETIAKVIADLEKTDDEDEKPNEDNKEDGTSANDEPPAKDTDDVDNDDLPPGSNDGAPIEEGATPPDADLPPVPPTDDVPPAEEPPVPPQEEVPPAPVPPAFNPDELIAKYEELKAANDGLLARVDSLEQALKDVGVLDKSDAEEVGIDDQRIPPSGSNGAVDAFDDALDFLNNRKHY